MSAQEQHTKTPLGYPRTSCTGCCNQLCHHTIHRPFWQNAYLKHGQVHRPRAAAAHVQVCYHISSLGLAPALFNSQQAAAGQQELGWIVAASEPTEMLYLYRSVATEPNTTYLVTSLTPLDSMPHLQGTGWDVQAGGQQPSGLWSRL
jgi:hypothetical protein